jgi:glycosyltransferase involved in cell wall biosynthesis
MQMLKKLVSLITRANKTQIDIKGTPHVKVVFLPNVKMANKRANIIIEDGPNPLREIQGFAKNGVSFFERDLHSFPLNLLANKGSFLAGLDPLRALKVLLFDRHADVIVSVFESNIFFILLLGRFFRFKPKVVLWEVSGRGWPKRDKVLDYVLPRVDHVLVLTKHQKKQVDSLYKLRNPAALLGFAIDDCFFLADQQKKPDRGYVLAVGDDVSRDYSTLIEACRGLSLPLKIRSSAKFVIPEESKSLISTVGRLTYTELRDLYDGATVVVVPLKLADYPGGITAVFEAMAMGKPLIASRTGTTSDFISNGEDGILITPECSAELSNAIITVWNNKELAKKLGDSARARLDKEFSYDSYIKRFALHLRRISTTQ